MFQTNGSQFELDGTPIRLISGAIHYFRIVPEYWTDRLTKLKACGFNTVETYVPWNLHEPKEGQFNFDGLANIVKFIEIAGELGLHVIVRPSPYICAEWEFGGLPSWLLSDSDMRLRCFHQPFLDKVDAYYDVLLPLLVPLLHTNGGPIIAMQIENEYGSYGNDTRYLEYLRDGMVNRGIDVLLFTSDGPTDWMLQGGMVDGVLATVNFGSKPAEAFAKLREYRPDDPLFCMEFWNGWFDHWGEEHHIRPAEDVAQVLDEMLQAGASVNFYMFHGGTNFGFYNGANCFAKYEPTITSYDYDVPLNESGEPTPKFFAVREVIAKYADIGECVLPAPIPKRAYGSVTMSQSAPLFTNLDQLSPDAIQRVCPEPMEKLGQQEGFILYSTIVSGPRIDVSLRIQDVHDRALVFLDDKYVGVIERWDVQPIQLTIPAGGAKLSLLVENMGRVNYGYHMWDRKGITEGVLLNNQFLFGWTIHTLPCDSLSLSGLAFGAEAEAAVQGPMFYKGTFHADAAADTFIALQGWTKGVVWVNGFNLGRYWERGPQQTLYVPGPLLRVGNNEIIVFELHGTEHRTIELLDTPNLG